MLKSRAMALRVLRPTYVEEMFVARNLCQVADDEKEKELQRIANDALIDEPPTSCCLSGCSNCVYIVWAEALTKKMNEAGPEITQKIIDMVEDPSMKAYLEMEFRIRGMKKS